MPRKILITGGAGFIGSHLADLLLANGYQVRALDNLDPQIHGEDRRPPDYLDDEVELVIGDIRDGDVVRHCLHDVDAVFHFAARVGVGQSMYEVTDYTDVNNRGTTVLLECMIERAKRRPFDRLVVASSMSIYGEGLYQRPDGGLVGDALRSIEQLRLGRFDPSDHDGAPLTPLATPETKTPSLMSVYALSKYDQERLCLLIGNAYDIPAVALRFFNVYGPRQALSNPYSGVLAIFASRLLNGKPPLIFEDGAQQRDFVHVGDIAAACRLALEVDGAVGRSFNIGSGGVVTVRELAKRLARTIGVEIEPEITGQCRIGDVRHCFPDIGLAQTTMGFQPRMPIDAGMEELAGWLEGRIAIDRVAEAREALAVRSLTI
ncbi:MAG: NDP-sugar oxidoreductase UDP-glucose 4-epimerase [Rhodospirillales bacterium]|nr:NDP-sugar oxidoreductase UDP-glucose 4-epimerase [Rhodospirillales bacterium]